MAFLELKNVSKSYAGGGKRTPVLADINLSIREGEFVAIVGYSGAGKTTLISMLAGVSGAGGGGIEMAGGGGYRAVAGGGGGVFEQFLAAGGEGGGENLERGGRGVLER